MIIYILAYYAATNTTVTFTEDGACQLQDDIDEGLSEAPDMWTEKSSGRELFPIWGDVGYDDNIDRCIGFGERS